MTDARIPPAETHDDTSPTPDAEWWMRELLASLPPPPTPEELARQQGISLPRQWEEILPAWAEGEWDGEEDFDTAQRRWRQEDEQHARGEWPSRHDAKVGT